MRRRREIRPVRAAVSALFSAMPQLRPRAEKLLWRGVYEAASLRRRGPGITLMNYGYAPAADGDAAGADQDGDRFGRQLYAAVAGAADLADKDVLEVGCGRGGGAAFVFEQFRPSSLTGLDLAGTAIERCRAQYARPGLTFIVGDAEQLPFSTAAFDAVISVESSHCYSDMPRFLREVHRVLRPDGLLLLADFRNTEIGSAGSSALAADLRLRQQFAEAGFGTLQEEDITADVKRALERMTPVVHARVRRSVPRPLRKHALEFSAVEGSVMYRAFAGGELKYLRFVLKRA